MQQAHAIQDARYLTGQDFDWEQRRVGIGMVQLFVQAQPADKVMYQYVWHVTPDDDPNTGVSNIPVEDIDFIVNYTLAKAKQILGRILRKFGGGMNQPDGSTEQLDGGELMTEGKAEQEALEQAMRKRRRPLEPSIG